MMDGLSIYLEVQHLEICPKTHRCNFRIKFKVRLAGFVFGSTK
jgi:hypothetical protein